MIFERNLFEQIHTNGLAETKDWPLHPMLGAHSWLGTQLGAEADQLAWACVCALGGREREQLEIERNAHFKLCQVIFLDDWLYFRPKEELREKNWGGGLMEDNGGEQVGSYGWETRVTSIAPAHI